MKPHVFCLSLLVIAAGCATVRDVSHNSSLNGGYVVGAHYRLKRDARLWKWRHERAAPDLAYYLDLSPASRPDEYWSPMGIVSEGTELRVLKMISVTGPMPVPFSTYTTVFPVAVIENGPFAGYKADLSEISGKRFEGSSIHTIAVSTVPDVLEQVGRK